MTTTPAMSRSNRQQHIIPKITPRAILLSIGVSILCLLLVRPEVSYENNIENKVSITIQDIQRPSHHDEQIINYTSNILPGSNVIIQPETLNNEDIHIAATQKLYLSQFSPDLIQFPPPPLQKKKKKYFIYQPSGGWGNQRYILRWAIMASNAMKRTLVIAPIAPHSDIWLGFNQFNKSQLVSAALVLDIRALQEAVDGGVVFLDDLPVRAVEAAKLAGMTIKTWQKGHYKTVRGQQKLYRMFESRISEEWGNVKEDVVFWEKGSMWECCLPDNSADGVWYGRHIMFNSRLKATARILATPLKIYNAVHVRRGDHALNDRRSAERYYKLHSLASFDKRLPLYIATDETYYGWFRYFRRKGKFTSMVFWKHLDLKIIEELLLDYPQSMHGDVLGFVEQLICGNAIQWEGSRESTFSAAISTIRLVPALRVLNWSLPIKPSLRKPSEDGGDLSSFLPSPRMGESSYGTEDEDNNPQEA